MRKPGFVFAATGLAAEARCAERSENVKAFAAGGREELLQALIEAAIRDGARGVISFGIAGGLKPGLAAGAYVVGHSVVAGDETYSADETWAARLASALPAEYCGAIAGSSVAVARPEAKAQLFAATGAIAADMESHVVAKLAASRGLPFAVLRVVADGADQTLPPAAIAGLKPDGTPDIAAVMKSLTGNPAQLGDLIRVALSTRRAMDALFRCHRLLGPGLGFADFG